ncbi:unnamed protein product [Ectocarpus sp. CCAP 1310/34]|nr:unnamed protein product [Ectocarpus sp. CCAP 1310/34]
MDVGDAAGSTITTDEASAAVAPAFECASTPSHPGVLRAIDMLAINSAGSAGGGSPSSPGSPMIDSSETPAQVSGGGGAMGGGVGGAESVTSAAAGSNESASEEGVYDGGSARAASSSESRAGSRRSRDRSSSDDSSSGRSTRQRRAGGGRGGGGGASGRSSRRSRYRDEGRLHSGGSSVSSQSPRWDRAVGGGGGGGGASPRRRGGGGADGSPRQTPEPSKVLHVRNVGHPVVQGDLVALLSCFGQVEKIKMFSGQALVQLPSVSVAKATMRHYEEDAEPKIGQKRVYLNYSRSRSIETRDGESLAVGATAGGGNFNSNNGGASNGGGGGNVNGGNNGLDLARAINAARGVGGMDGGSAGNPMQETPSPYAHLIMEDHAKLLGLATCYLQTYGIPGGEGAILNINQREEMAERQRQAMAAAFALTGANGHALHHAGMGAWNGNAAAAAAAAVAEAGRHSRGVSGGGGGVGAGGGGGVFSTGYGGRPRSGSRGRAGEGLDRLRR